MTEMCMVEYKLKQQCYAIKNYTRCLAISLTHAFTKQTSSCSKGNILVEIWSFLCERNHGRMFFLLYYE